MKKPVSKQEADFFRYFDNVELVDVPTDSLTRFMISEQTFYDRYIKEVK